LVYPPAPGREYLPTYSSHLTFPPTLSTSSSDKRHLCSYD